MTALASTPFTAATLVVGYALALLGVVLLVRVARGRPVGWRRVCAAARSLRVAVTHPATDGALRTAGWVMPGAGLALLAVASGAPRVLGVTGVLGFGVAVVSVLAVVACLPVVVSRRLPARRPRRAASPVAFTAGRVYTPRVATVAGSTRGNPVASPYPGVGGDATAVFSRVPAATPPGSRHRAGRDLAPLGSGRPVAARLESAKWGAPRRASGVPGRAVERAARPGIPAEQTAVLRRVQDAPTETWRWPAGQTTGHR